MKKLSIITINYNNASGLQNTIQSIRSQGFTDYEYIVIDGGSTDDSVAVIGKNKDIVHYWCSEDDKGVYDAMNKGIQVAKGDYCLFLNSGDILYNSSVLTDVFAQNLTVDIIYGNSFKVKSHYRRLIRYSSQFTLYDFVKTEPCIHHQAAFIKRKLFLVFGLYKVELKVNADWEFFFRVVILEHVITHYVDRTICRFDAGGLSNTLSRKNPFRKVVRDAKDEILNANFPVFVLADYKTLDGFLSRKSFFQKLWNKWTYFSFKK